MTRSETSQIWNRLAALGRVIGLFFAFLIICLPGAWIVLSSLRPTVEIMAKPPVWIPHRLSLDAYTAMFAAVAAPAGRTRRSARL